MPAKTPSPRRRKLPSRYGHFFLPLIITLVMTCIISGISTLRAVGPIAEFPGIWMDAWFLSWVVAFPILLLVLPLARRITAFLVESSPG
jgi:hypothetical protein